MNRTPILFLNVLVIATCGLIYELLAGTLASYVLGDSVTQFSMVIGMYLLAMSEWDRGFHGSSSRTWRGDLLKWNSASRCSADCQRALLQLCALRHFQIVLFVVVFAIGALVGLEIPLLMRILKDNLDFKELVSRVLTFDYIGALVASLLLFPYSLCRDSDWCGPRCCSDC